MVGVRLAAALWAVVLLGPLLDPHAHDPYHTHWVLSDTTPGPRWDVPAGQFPARPDRAPHPPGVAWLRGADPSVPAVLHAGALVPGTAAPALLVPPGPGLPLDADSRSLWTSVDLDPQDPPPRGA